MWGRRWECFLNSSSLYRHLIHWSPSSTHSPTVFSITSHFLCFIIFVFSPTCSLMPENISQACELFFQPPPSSLIGDACVCWVDKAGLSDHGLKISSYMASSLILEVITYSWWEPAMMWYLQPKELHKLVWGQRRRTEIELHHSLTFAYHHFLRKVLRRQRISLVLYAQAQMRLHQKIGANSSHWVRTQITTYSSVPSSL